MAQVSIRTEVIQDWTSFHEEFKRAMGFPDFYDCTAFVNTRYTATGQSPALSLVLF